MKEDEQSPIVPPAILETVIYCEDLLSAENFYREVIGLTLVSEEQGRHLFFRVGDSMLLIFNPQRTQQDEVRVGSYVIPQHGAVGEGHLAFAIAAEQIAETRDWLQKKQIRIESEIDWPTGGHSIYCRDPAGNSVEFATRELWFQSNTD